MRDDATRFQEYYLINEGINARFERRERPNAIRNLSENVIEQNEIVFTFRTFYLK